jgi:Ca2+-binding EF-hand superfamily protein
VDDGRTAGSTARSLIGQASLDRQAKAMDEAFLAMDWDKNGQIRKAEAAIVPITQTALDGLDLNNDGGLSRAQLRAS